MAREKTPVLLCDCGSSFKIDEAGLAAALEDVAIKPCAHGLCRQDIGQLTATARTEGDNFAIACTQEATTFAEHLSAEGLDVQPRLLNIRELAGWSSESESWTACRLLGRRSALAWSLTRS